MRILIYTHTFPPMIGGVETVTMALAQGLADWPKSHPDAMVDVTVATKTPPGDMDDSRLPFRVVRRPSLFTLASLVRTADIVHLAGPTLVPLLMGFLLRKRMVVEHHGYQSICPNGVLTYQLDKSVCPGHFMAGRYRQCVRCEAAVRGSVRSLLLTLLTFPRRWLCTRVTANIAVSNHVARRVTLPRTRTIYHGLAGAASASSTPTTGDSRELKICYVGRFVEGKGLPTLLDAAKLLSNAGRDFHLTLIGDGPLRESLARMAESPGLLGRVSFTGFLSGGYLEEVLGGMHVVVLPSECEETAGLAAIEQMIRGGVVVAANIGGLGEVVGDAGLTFASGDAVSLASRLRQLQDEPCLQARLASRARERAARLFARDTMISEHVACYREAMAHKEE